MVVIPHKVSSTGRTKELNIIYSTQNVNTAFRKLYNHFNEINNPSF